MNMEKYIEMKRNNFFFHKLFISFILCGLIPLLIITATLYGFAVNFVRDMIYDQTYRNISIAHDKINSLFQEYDEIIEKLHKDEIILDVLSGEISMEDNSNRVYEQIYSALEGVVDKPPLYILGREKEVKFYTYPLPDSHEIAMKYNWGVFREADGALGKTVFYPQKIKYSMGQNTVLTISRSIYNNEGNCIGYIVIDVFREKLADIFQSSINSLPMEILVLDKYSYTILDLQDKKMEGYFQNAVYLDGDEEVETTEKSLFQFKRSNSVTIIFPNEKYNMTTYATVSLDILNHLSSSIKTILIIGYIISLLICSIISIILAKDISDPIREIISLMKKVEKGNFDVEANFKQRDEIGLLAMYFNRMVVRLKKYLDEIIEKQNQLRETEIKMLQAQINPHFLYNTLDVIKWSAKLNRPDEVTKVVTNLAKILRNSIDCEEEFTTIEESLEFLISYLNIQKIKYNNKFRIEIDVDPYILQQKIPRLLLQPFVENAIIHGISGTDKKGLITIGGEKVGNEIVFYVTDNGIGMTADEMKVIEREDNENHVGINNVRKRIKLYYGDTYGIEFESKKNKGTKVIVKIPFEMGDEINHDKGYHC